MLLSIMRLKSQFCSSVFFWVADLRRWHREAISFSDPNNLGYNNGSFLQARDRCLHYIFSVPPDHFCILQSKSCHLDLSVAWKCLHFLWTVLGELCPSHCNKDGEYVESFNCGGDGFCCGNANDIYCCVDYWDRYSNLLWKWENTCIDSK